MLNKELDARERCLPGMHHCWQVLVGQTQVGNRADYSPMVRLWMYLNRRARCTRCAPTCSALKFTWAHL